MEVSRHEIGHGVMLSYLKTDKFKTSFMSISLLAQLTRETAALNAILPRVLLRGSVLYPDMKKLSVRMEELYGASVSPIVSRRGEIQLIGLVSSFPEEAFLPKGANEFREVTELMAGILLNPVTRGGLLLQQYVDSEKEKMIQDLESIINNKRAYSFRRCYEEMCCYEDYAVGKAGRAEDVEAINYKKATRRYRDLLASAPVEIFYCGQEDVKRVISVLKGALATMPRGEIDYDIGTDIRMNSVEAEPRRVDEEMAVSQARLAIGYRLGECMEQEDLSAVRVFNTIFGGSSNSRLFENVREKLHLCYDASSLADTYKGLLFVFAGIDPANFDAALNEINAQLDSIRNGEISEEELATAKAIVASDLRAKEDSQGDLESFYTARALTGDRYSPAEAAAMVEYVTAEDVAEVARGVECDMIYFLTGNGSEPEDEETEGQDE